MMAQASGTSETFGKKEGLTGSLSGLVTAPGRWFAENYCKLTPHRAGGMLVLASLFYAVIGGISATKNGALTNAAILMVNALGMPLLNTAIAWFIGIFGGGPRFRLSSLWMVFAVATSPTLFIAWVPFAFFFTEPWKWWLIGTGMVNGLGMSKTRATIIVLFTFGATVTIIFSIMSVVNHLAGHSI